MECIATCPTGFEQVLAEELRERGVPRVRPLQGQVSFEGTLTDAYVACLWSHVASRIMVVIGRGPAKDSDELYATVKGISWQDHIVPGSSIAVSASGTNAQLRTTQFVAMRVKDAIVDQLVQATGARPRVDPKFADLTIVARVSKSRVTLGIDLAGDPLFRRGYEQAGLRYGLRPDYAASLLRLSGWHEYCERDTGEPLLLDATQGPSVIVVEAALMAAHRAPGLLRFRWGFSQWAQHEATTWERLVAKAQAVGTECVPVHLTTTAGKGLSPIRASLRAAGLDAEVALFEAGSHNPQLLLCDLSSVSDEDLVRESAELATVCGTVVTAQPERIGIVGRDQLASSFLRCDPTQSLTTALGRDPLYLHVYDGAQVMRDAPSVQVRNERVPVLVAASDQFAARLRKVARVRDKWAKGADVTCYRVYDADLPDYAVSIDLYQGTDPKTGMTNGMRWLYVSEYAAPKSVDQQLAQSRLVDVLAIAPKILDVRPQETFLRVRRHAKGGSQYASEGIARDVRPRTNRKGGLGLPPGAHLIDEGGLTFEVNFSTRLDCGIFLDHRDTRALLREMAKQTKGSKRFLNLFAYTGTATCYAADGGALHTTTVDLSRPSLDWARRNMERNGFCGRDHEYVQADVVSWVSEQRHTRNRWDLIFCDVPTFSNSSRMGRRSFDVQRDHAELIIGVSRLLTREGSCIFSCNLRTFKPNTAALAKAGVVLEDITERTIPEDFVRNQRIHHAYIVRRGEA